MTYGTVSPKYQIVIPKTVRQTVGIKPGQRLMIYAKGSMIYLIPEIKLADLRGICAGTDSNNLRDEDDRL